MNLRHFSGNIHYLCRKVKPNTLIYGLITFSKKHYMYSSETIVTEHNIGNYEIF